MIVPHLFPGGDCHRILFIKIFSTHFCNFNSIYISEDIQNFPFLGATNILHDFFFILFL